MIFDIERSQFIIMINCPWFSESARAMKVTWVPENTIATIKHQMVWEMIMMNDDYWNIRINIDQH